MSNVSNLESHMGYLLRMISNAVSQEFARKMAGNDVTVAEWVLMRSLYDVEAISPSALARKMSMTKGAISKLAERLVDKGLIERSHNSDDKRGHSLSLSVRGREKVPLLAGLADENDTAFFAVLSHADQDTLRNLLKALIDAHLLSVVPVD